MPCVCKKHLPCSLTFVCCGDGVDGLWGACAPVHAHTAVWSATVTSVIDMFSIIPVSDFPGMWNTSSVSTHQIGYTDVQVALWIVLPPPLANQIISCLPSYFELYTDAISRTRCN